MGDPPSSAPPIGATRKTFDWFSSWSSLSQELIAGSPSTGATDSDAGAHRSSGSNLYASWTPEERIRRHKDRDPILIERSNLVNILKLVIKEVIDSSLRFGRQLDSDHIPLQHFFIVLEHVLRHGLRPKKGLLGPKKELWDILQLIEKHDIEAADITASVRDLPTVKTQIGRARAWLRLALMQKKLSDYFRVLIDLNYNNNKDDDLSELYDPQALLRSEEAVIIMGHLVSLNVVDCNLCVKEEDLDSQQGVIDFSLYLRNKKDYPEEEDPSYSGQKSADGNEKSEKKMFAVLDQKNYIEELNRHLNATVTNLEAKVESLTATNALMKEDLAICKNSLFRTEEENRKLINQIDSSCQNSPRFPEPSSESMSDLKLSPSFQEEVMKRVKLQKELDLQLYLKEETEMAMKLLEKDMHEKQDTIISLRDQLEDIKKINLEMYSKLQEFELLMKSKAEQITRLESDNITVKIGADTLKNKYSTCKEEKSALNEEITLLNSSLERYRNEVKGLKMDLKIEKDWRQSLLREVEKSKKEIETFHREAEDLRSVARDCDRLKRDNSDLKQELRENALTMEELGNQLQFSKLQAESIREEKDFTFGQTWQDDNDSVACGLCSAEFGNFRRKHHCRNCGKIFCDKCSDNKMKLASSVKPMRVCDVCHALLFEAYAKKL